MSQITRIKLRHGEVFHVATALAVKEPANSVSGAVTSRTQILFGGCADEARGMVTRLLLDQLEPGWSLRQVHVNTFEAEVVGTHAAPTSN